ncbi:MAG: GAF and ANTAR domain-containing protein [Acidobacteria bacterium]|nr:GAF and ANTAR domain-containing protein [Acidobacteriota bacterium]
MSSEGLIAIYAAMARHESDDGERGSLCAVASEIVGVRGAGIILANDPVTATSFCGNNSFARSVIDLEVAVGEGPCSESLTIGTTSSESDLSSAAASRWIFFAPQAYALGVRAAFGFPMRLGGIRLGALCLYCDQPGDLSDDQCVTALLLTSVVGRAILALQAGAPPGTLSEELRNESTLDFSVHQAAGMVSVQGAVDISAALGLLRTRAFVEGQKLREVATRVIRRELRYDSSQSRWSEVSL